MKTGLFWSLHRAVKALFWCFWIAVAGFLYTQRAAFQPAADLAQIWWNQPSDRPAELARLSGRVTRLFAGDSLQLQDEHGWLFNYGLAGVAAPRPNPTATALERLAAHASQTNLARLVLGKRIDIEVTLANPQNRTGQGLVRVDGTNINETVLRSGWTTLKREQIRVLPILTQYELVRAERLAQREGLGLWAPDAAPGSESP